MFYRSVCWLICTFVAVATATGRSGQESNTESSVAEPVQEVRRDPAVELGWLLDAGEGAAVTLVSGDTRLLAHRAVLVARSPVFQRILQDAATGEVALQDVEGPVLRRLLAYLYTLQAPQLPAMAPQLLAGAHQYGLPALKADCERQVAAQLTVQTAAATAALAVRYSSDSLKRAAIDYIRDHIFDVMATQGWADALRIQPEVMIQVTQLLSQSPAETSSTTPAESGPSFYAATQPHSSTHSSATAATTVAAQTVPQTDDDHISVFRSTAPAESGPSPYAATQTHSSTHSLATAASTVAAQTEPQTDDDRISVLQSLSPEEKGSRLIEAAMRGEVGELEALLAACADVGARDGKWNRTALHWAAVNGREEAARRLLAAGAALDARSSGQYTPLHYAAREGHAAVVRLLLAAGADVAARDGEWWARTPLHWAAYMGREEAVRWLLAAGAAVDAWDDWQWTPLHEATRNGYAAVVRLLLAAGANHGARERDGWTPLHMAAFNDNTEAAAALVKAGADRAARENEGRTPLDLARERHHEQMVQLLEGNTSLTATTLME